jgi:hypothetical protein
LEERERKESNNRDKTMWDERLSAIACCSGWMASGVPDVNNGCHGFKDTTINKKTRKVKGRGLHGIKSVSACAKVHGQGN